MINIAIYAALIYLVRCVSVKKSDVPKLCDLLMINWVMQLAAWEPFLAVPPLGWLALETAFALACIVIVTTRVAAIVALMSIPTIVVHATSFAISAPLDPWVNATGWAQMLVFIIAGWNDGLGRFVAKMADPDRRFAGY